MIVAGFGFRASADTGSLMDALWQARKGLEGNDQPLTHLAAPADKTVADCFTELARTLALPVVSVEADTLAAIQTPTESVASMATRRTGSVAEAAALAVAGAGGRLLCRRAVSSDRLATCALAMGDSP